MRPIKLFSEFLHPPRAIISLPLVGQMQTSQLVMTIGVALLGGMPGQAAGGMVAWFFCTLFFGIGTLVLMKKEDDHAPMSERLLGLLRYAVLRRMSADALSFRPQDAAPLTADSLQAFITLGEDRRGVLLRRRGGR